MLDKLKFFMTLLPELESTSAWA